MDNGHNDVYMVLLLYHSANHDFPITVFRKLHLKVLFSVLPYTGPISDFRFPDHRKWIHQ